MGDRERRSAAGDGIERRTRGYLPHWERDGATYFLTIRVADSLPKRVREDLQLERSIAIEAARRAGEPLSSADLALLKRDHARRIEVELDCGVGSCPLKDPRIASLVADSIRHFDGERYDLSAWCVMPNHVHLVVSMRVGHSIERFMHSLKTYTARASNRILGRRGSFWQREYYDHLIRGENSLRRAIKYVAENPAKAGLKDWPWVWKRVTKEVQ